jgi:hypothetical protein
LPVVNTLFTSKLASVPSAGAPTMPQIPQFAKASMAWRSTRRSAARFECEIGPTAGNLANRLDRIGLTAVHRVRCSNFQG